MAKANKKKNVKKTIENTPKQPSILFNNFIVAVGVCITLLLAYNSNLGYPFVVQSLAWKNTQIALENPDLTMDQKFGAKLGKDYQFVKYIRENTPENAVIIMPERDVFKDSPFNNRGTWGVKTKIWSTYFLYPRQLIVENEKEKFPDVYNNATHVLVINGWGIEKLDYPVTQTVDYGVLPIKSEVNTQ